jgi:hypothetical protein
LGGCPPIERGAGEFGRKVHELNSPMSKEYHEVIEYTVKINMKDSSLRSFAEAEQKARDMTFHPGQADASERLFQIPPDPVTCRKKHNGEWFGAEKLDLDALCPAGLENIIILSACADISRSAAKSMSRPLEMAALGRRVGMEVAAHASRGRTRLKTIARAESSLIEPRPWNLSGKTVRTRKNTIPVAGEYDVVIIGGGTSGASAAVAAARAGVKTLVVEYLCGLGGVSTSGMIGMYCGGYRKGFTAELENGVRKIKAESYIVGKMEYWRSEIRAAGGDMLFGTVCTEAIIKNGGFKGVIVGSDNGRAAILSSVVIDCTGNADMAAAAGAECVVGGTSHFCVQRTGIPPRELGANYINSDWTYVLDSDMTDRFTAFLSARRFNGDAYDLSQIIDSRERRRIKGELTLSAMDIVNARTFSDTICVSESKTFDKHGQPAHPYYHINNFPGGISYIPYRAIIPKDLDGLLVAGIGCAADCDALPSIRMQPEMQNLGYAAGIAAAMAARNGGGVRDIDIRELQRRLVSAGCLPPDVLSHHDAAPLSDERINAAVKKLREDDYSDLKCVMAEPERSVSALRKALGKHGNTAGKLRCAHALGMLGDPSGVKILIDEVEKHRSFDGDIIGHWFPNITWLDSYILGLGHSGDQRAVTPLLEKLDSLLSLKGVQWSNHLESVIAALETLASRRAAEPVCKLLRKELENGGALTLTGEESLEKRSTLGMHALLLAECLFKCGDQRGFARKVLESFSKDIRGYFAIRAREILSKNRNKLPKGVLKKCL